MTVYHFILICRSQAYQGNSLKMIKIFCFGYGRGEMAFVQVLLAHKCFLLDAEQQCKRFQIFLRKTGVMLSELMRQVQGKL